ncbi:MAG: ParB N-terminal domain-containing protein [Gemmatimonadota bacterium]|nr:MAG: ParB N-terminal domain-containing protein [Gemmatimonadota bacterium]
MAKTEKSAKAKKERRGSKKKAAAEPGSRGLTARALSSASAPGHVQALAEAIEADRGSVLAVYRDPLGGNWQVLAGLPIERVEPTPFQRDLSPAHVERLAEAIDKLDRYLDPVIAVRTEEGKYWTPNGYHRLEAARSLGAKAITGLVVPDVGVAYRILALNTEKAHNLRERALEVARLAAALAELDDRPEREFATEIEEPALLTLGLCYLERGRFAGGAYHPVLRRVEKLTGAKLSSALKARGARAARVLELDDAVTAAVKGLKERGFESPYLRAFVVARINPLRFKRKVEMDADETIEKMLSAAQRFDIDKVRADQLARASGPADD